MKIIFAIGLTLFFIAACGDKHRCTNVGEDVTDSSGSRGHTRYNAEGSFVISADDFPTYLRDQYLYDSTIEKLVATKYSFKEKITRIQITNTSKFSTKDYQIVYEYNELKNLDSSFVNLYVNGNPVKFYDIEDNSDTVTVDIDFGEGCDLLTYEWDGRKYVMFMGEARGAQSWYGEIWWAVLINVSSHPMKAYELATYGTPGGIYFKGNAANGKLTCLSTMCLLGKDNCDSLTVAIHEIP